MSQPTSSSSNPSQQILDEIINSGYALQQSNQEQETETDSTDVQQTTQKSQQLTSQRTAISKGVGTTPQETVTKAADASEATQFTSATAKPTISQPMPQMLSTGGPTVQSSQGLSLIAIMAEVMILQSKANSDFFQSLWNQASSSMEMEAELAPIMAKATLQAGMAQAQQSKAEASQALTEGIISIVTFAASALAGGLMPTEGDAAEEESQEGTQVAKETQKPGEEEEIAQPEAEDETAATQETTQAAQTQAQDRTQGTEEEAEAQASKTKQAEKQQAEGEKTTDTTQQKVEEGAQAKQQSTWEKIKSAFTMSKAKGLGKILSNFQANQGMVQMIQSLGQGANGIATYVYKNRIAAYQVQAAQWQAVQQMAETQIQYWGQAFSRADSQSQQAQQNINSSLQLLEGVVQTITQTVSSGFSNI